MQVFYSTEFEGNICTLNEDESAHCIRVLRLVRGNAIHIIDGKGGFYEATITEAHSKCCKAQIISAEQEFGKRNYCLHIGIAPPKNVDRYDCFLEKATEIGVDCITPLLCERSERRVVKHEHSQKILIAASKQSLSAYVPELQVMTAFTEFVQRPFAGKKYIAHCNSDATISFYKDIENDIDTDIKNERNILVLIGAEGDFSSSEIALAQQYGFVGVNLGKRRLRTETAGIAVCHALAMICAINHTKTA
jgi:16S rRNA (uracil1498-N3)-methyltransferase